MAERSTLHCDSRKSSWTITNWRRGRRIWKQAVRGHDQKPGGTSNTRHPQDWFIACGWWLCAGICPAGFTTSPTNSPSDALTEHVRAPENKHYVHDCQKCCGDEIRQLADHWTSDNPIILHPRLSNDRGIDSCLPGTSFSLHRGQLF